MTEERNKLLELREKVANLSEEELKLRDLYLKQLADSKIQGPVTGYPSLDKPWLGWYDECFISLEIPKISAYEYLVQKNQDNLQNVAINYYGNEITFEEFFRKIEETAKAYRKLGVSKGDVVTVFSMTNPELEITLYALNMLGAVINLMDVRSDSEKLEQELKNSNSKVLLIMDNFIDKVVDFKNPNVIENIITLSPYNSLPKLKNKIVSILKHDTKLKANKMKLKNMYNMVEWNEFISNGVDVELENIFGQDVSNELVALVHTGGTTGVAKTVKLSNKNFNSMVINFEAFKAYEKGDKFLNVIVPFVAYGVLGAMHLPLCLGLTNIIAPIITPKEFTEFMIKYKPNNLLAVPTYWDDFINNKKVQKMDLSFLKHPGSGGDATPKEKEIKINDFFADRNSEAVIELGYGMTEVGSAATACVGKINSIQSVGVPLVKNEAKVINPDTNEEVNFNELGEICLTAPTTMLGYVDNKEEEEKLFYFDENNKRWIRSGDLGYMDEKGFIYLVGRIKRMLIRGGFKVYPSEIENVITKNYGINECCVVGKNSKEYGNEPVAYITIKNGMEYDTENLIEQIKNECMNLLSSYSVPIDFIVIEEMPLTAVGKIDYKKLETLCNSNEKQLVLDQKKEV